MHIARLLATHYKNIAATDLSFSEKMNVLYGNNGEGKTNLLDALYYLSVCKSFFPISDKDTITYSASQTTLYGEYVMDSGITEKIACQVDMTQGKTFKRNGKTYARISEHVGLIPVVMVSPQDTSLVYGSGEERRRYMNFLMAQTDPDYLRTVLEYTKLLVQRNKMLKADSYEPEYKAALDDNLCQRAQTIYAKRAELCAMLHPYVKDYYRLLSDDKEPIDLVYQSDLNKEPMAVLLQQYADRDRDFHYTSVGVQRDDVQFSLRGHPLKVCGSQGQQKTFLLALKLAQFALIRQRKNMAPILLLDDVFDKLDAHRVASLLQLVAQADFGQIFLTDSNKVRIEKMVATLGGPSRFFNVEKGVIA